jgi:ubiquinone/menaquinone biosynthesis C-methylase UbiE
MRVWLLACLSIVSTACAHGERRAAADAEAPAASRPEAQHGHRVHTMHHRFDDAERWAEQFDDPGRDSWQRPDAVLELLALRDDARVADVGAGTGYFTVRLARAVPRGKVWASDIEPDMVRYLGERAQREGLTNVVAVLGERTDPRLPEPVDAILVVDVVHHVADRAGFFANLRRLLAPGGRLVVVDFSPEAPEDGPGPPKRHRIGPEEMTGMLEAAGLRRVAHERLQYQYALAFVRDEPSP